MSTDFWSTIATIIAMIILRVMSHFEHRKTARKVMEIYLNTNGEMQKKIIEAFEEGKKSSK